MIRKSFPQGCGNRGANPPLFFYACCDIDSGTGKPADLMASGRGMVGARKGSGQAVKAKAGQLGMGGQVAD